jgi:hypothetical protein
MHFRERLDVLVHPARSVPLYLRGSKLVGAHFENPGAIAQVREIHVVVGFLCLLARGYYGLGKRAYTQRRRPS